MTTLTGYWNILSETRNMYVYLVKLASVWQWDSSVDIHYETWDVLCIQQEASETR